MIQEEDGYFIYIVFSFKTGLVVQIYTGKEIRRSVVSSLAKLTQNKSYDAFVLAFHSYNTHLS